MPEIGESINLTLFLNQEGVGPILGLSPELRIRRNTSPATYLDFSDGVMKTIGWVTPFVTMLDLGGGSYFYSIPAFFVVGISPRQIYIAEYKAFYAGETYLVYEDVVIEHKSTDLDLLRKIATNRMELIPGPSSVQRLYDDDNSTLIGSWPISDSSSGPILSAQGQPFKRGKLS